MWNEQSWNGFCQSSLLVFVVELFTWQLSRTYLYRRTFLSTSDESRTLLLKKFSVEKSQSTEICFCEEDFLSVRSNCRCQKCFLIMSFVFLSYKNISQSHLLFSTLEVLFSYWIVCLWIDELENLSRKVEEKLWNRLRLFCWKLLQEKSTRLVTYR